MDSRLAPSPADTDKRLGLDVNGIMWTDATVNPGLFGCSKVSLACTNCYAEQTAARLVSFGGPAGARYAQGLTDGRWNGRVVVRPDQIAPSFHKIPWKLGKVRRVFVTSMSDLFHDDVPFSFIDAVFAEMAARPQVFQVLTKRAERMAAYAADRTARGLPWPANVWVGVTVEDQRRADERIPWLLCVPAAVRFLSVEPMLGALDIARWLGEGQECCGYPNEDETGQYCCGSPNRVVGVSWLIVGSESDGPRPGKRETQYAWVLDLVDQCGAAGVPCFVKQLAIGGRLCSLPMVDGRVRAEFPQVTRD
jgi:protein gp37